MFNRKYKKGMADAAKAYEAFGKKQEDALNFILEEVRQGKKSMEDAIQDLDGNIDNLYDYLKSKEKAQLYTVYTPFDIKKLGDQEKLFLVGALYSLTRDKTPNENQQNYLRAVQKYLEIKEPPFGVDPLAIENIEDLPTQKAIFQAVLEFLQLQDGDSYDETELQQEFLDSFSINSKSRQAILHHVEMLYMATGAQGLAEKYGYVPEEDEKEYLAETTNNCVCEESEGAIEIGDDQVGEIFDKIFEEQGEAECRGILLETDHYFLFWEVMKDEAGGGINYIALNKQSLKCKIMPNLSEFSISYRQSKNNDYDRGYAPSYIKGDTVYFESIAEDKEAIWCLDLVSGELKEVARGYRLFKSHLHLTYILLEKQYLPCLQNDHLCVLNIETCKFTKVRYKSSWISHPVAITTAGSLVLFCVSEDQVGGDNDCFFALCSYDVDNNKLHVLERDSKIGNSNSGGWHYQYIEYEDGYGLKACSDKIFIFSGEGVFLLRLKENKVVKSKTMDIGGGNTDYQYIFGNQMIWTEDTRELPLYLFDFDTEKKEMLAKDMGYSQYKKGGFFSGGSTEYRADKEFFAKIGRNLYLKNSYSDPGGCCVSLTPPYEKFDIKLSHLSYMATDLGALLR